MTQVQKEHEVCAFLEPKRDKYACISNSSSLQSMLLMTIINLIYFRARNFELLVVLKLILRFVSQKKIMLSTRFSFLIFM